METVQRITDKPITYTTPKPSHWFEITTLTLIGIIILFDIGIGYLMYTQAGKSAAPAPSATPFSQPPFPLPISHPMVSLATIRYQVSGFVSTIVDDVKNGKPVRVFQLVDKNGNLLDYAFILAENTVVVENMSPAARSVEIKLTTDVRKGDKVLVDFTYSLTHQTAFVDSVRLVRYTITSTPEPTVTQ